MQPHSGRENKPGEGRIASHPQIETGGGRSEVAERGMATGGQQGDIGIVGCNAARGPQAGPAGGVNSWWVWCARGVKRDKRRADVWG